MFKKFLVVAFMLFALTVVAQDAAELPPPAEQTELPGLILALLGFASAFIIEFVQKQKSPLASLAIAVAFCAVIGLVSTIIAGVPLTDAPAVIVQTFAFASTTWAVLFKALKFKKVLNT
jgi:FtsH-binding integral membrane protein